MKIKNMYFETLSKVQSLLTKEFSAKTSFYLARIFDKIQSESKIYFSEKQRLVDKYAKKDDKGKNIIQGDSILLNEPEKFQKEFDELMGIEIDLGLDKIKIDFDNEPKLSINEMMILFNFIEEEK